MTVFNGANNYISNSLSTADYTQKATTKQDTKPTETKPVEEHNLKFDPIYKKSVSKLAEKIESMQLYTKEAAKVIAEGILEPKIHIVA